jgi:hypothetical protein
MITRRRTPLALVAYLALAGSGTVHGQGAIDLLDAAKGTDVAVAGGRAKPDSVGAGGRLRISATGSAAPEAVVAAPGGKWDLSKTESVVVRARNLSDGPLTVRARVEAAGAHGLADTCRGAVVLRPGEEKEVRVRLVRRPKDPGYAVFEPFYMYFKAIDVRDNTIDPAAVARVVVGFDATRPGQAVEITRVAAVGEGVPAPVAFFPFVDAFGQYAHADWPGKIRSTEDFAARRNEEAAERRQWPGPSDWDKYGGWANGPKLKATGFFYPAKHEGKWWLVDPDGRLFWSYGPTGVGFGGDASPITDREEWFGDLPPRDSEWGPFYRDGEGATYRYYQKRKWVGFDFAPADLMRKYGPDYKTIVGDLSHERIRNWGFNTLGNWSAPEVYLRKRTPYTVAIHYGGVPMIHYRMPDVYDPTWEPAVRRAMEGQRDTTAGDPWNVGYFVDNERWWGWRPRAAAIGEETLKNPPERRAKIEFVDRLRARYGDVVSLNKAWGTSHASWEAVLQDRGGPDLRNEAVLKDCGDFGMAFAERYFTTVRGIVKAMAPDNLYLGARFHGHVDVEVVRLASRYADVVSYNIYDNPPTGRVNQYNALDVPILSTEWGVGSDPRQTPFRGDETSATNPNERTEAIVKYVEAALRHPNMVGAHFFQYRDQPISGRPDGEATLRGFVNIADTPNFELIQVNRRLASEMYRTRQAAK